jgi:wyosine [tRNA(Phe)-imidazoG37] synthetase (radical SAM superfamily)
MTQQFKYVYGPVFSWRLGKSLGIDPLSDREKICNMDCIYCQLGKTNHLTNERKIYVSTWNIIDEVTRVGLNDLDYITISGRGEPTLALNLGNIIGELKKIRKEGIAVITNASLLDHQDVQDDLAQSDYVIAKLDACDQNSLLSVDKPVSSLHFDSVSEGLQSFRKRYHGRLAIQIMFVDENKDISSRIAELVRNLEVDEVQINTPLRPCASRPLSEEQLFSIKQSFRGLPAVTVYEAERRQDIVPLDDTSTILRHGNYKKKNRKTDIKGDAL